MKTQKGFGVVKIVIVTGVIILISFATFFIFTQQKESKNLVTEQKTYVEKNFKNESVNNENSENLLDDKNVAFNEAINTNTSEAMNFYGYIIEEYDRVIPFEYEEYSHVLDQSIVNYHTDGTREIIVKSVKEALPILQDDWNHILSEVSVLQNANSIIFEDVYMATDVPFNNLYRFDLVSKLFTKMETSYYNYDRGRVLSPDGRHFVTIIGKDEPIGKQIYIVSLIDDTVKKINVVGGVEVLYRTCDLGCETYITWIENTAVHYSVYEDVGEKWEINPFIEFRTVNIY